MSTSRELPIKDLASKEKVETTRTVGLSVEGKLQEEKELVGYFMSYLDQLIFVNDTLLYGLPTETSSFIN